MQQRDFSGKFISMWDDEKCEIARKLYVDEKKSLRYIANYFGCSLGPVQQLVKKNGWMREKSEFVKDRNGFWKKVTKINRDTAKKIIKARRDYGLNYVELATIFDIPREKLREFLKSKKLTLSPKECSKKAGEFRTQRAIDYYHNLKVSDTYENYRHEATKLAIIMCSHYKKQNKKGFEIDHKLSVRDGFNLKIPIKIISHPANLRIVTKRSNQLKGSKSIITYERLKRDIQKFNKTYGNPYKGGNLGQKEKGLQCHINTSAARS